MAPSSPTGGPGGIAKPAGFLPGGVIFFRCPGILRLDDCGYTKSVLQAQLNKLRDELKMLETTSVQAFDPVTVTKSALGGHDYFVS